MKPSRNLSILSLLGLTAAGLGCAAGSQKSETAATTAVSPSGSAARERPLAPPVRGDDGAPDPKRDREAILAMAGEFEVDFHFAETASLSEGYSTWAPYESAATEFVEVIEDTETHISMQHVLVLGERVVKHWRQDWTYEDDSYYEYRGHRVWKERQLSTQERRGSWVQRVFQVDDSPRYASHGYWTHHAGVSSWESGTTWRPLPRRDYTRRDDYQVLVVRNRHTITPDGWIHEQDNSKLVLTETGEPLKYLAREIGTNTYTRTRDVDFSPGRAYWQKTRAYWSDVRAAWRERFDSGEPVSLVAEVDDRPMWKHMFEMAEEVKAAGSYDAGAMRTRIDAALAAFDAADLKIHPTP